MIRHLEAACPVAVILVGHVLHHDDAALSVADERDSLRESIARLDRGSILVLGNGDEQAEGVWNGHIFCQSITVVPLLPKDLHVSLFCPFRILNLLNVGKICHPPINCVSGPHHVNEPRGSCSPSESLDQRHVCHRSETAHSRYVVSFTSFSTPPVEEVSTKSALPTAAKAKIRRSSGKQNPLSMTVNVG